MVSSTGAVSRSFRPAAGAMLLPLLLQAAAVARADCDVTFLTPLNGSVFNYLDAVDVSYESTVSDGSLITWCGVFGAQINQSRASPTPVFVSPMWRKPKADATTT